MGRHAKSPVLARMIKGAVVVGLVAASVGSLSAEASTAPVTTIPMLFSWGLGFQGGVGNGGTSDVATPVRILLPGGVAPLQLAVNSGVGDRGMVIGTDHNLYGWGGNANGQLGNATTSTSPVLNPTAVSMPPGITAQSVAVGASFTLMIGSDSHLYAWGDNTNGELGADPSPKSGPKVPSSDVPIKVALPAGVVPASISAGLDDAAMISTHGELYTWGDNNEGQLGQGLDPTTHPFAWEPTMVSGIAGTVAQVALGQSFAAALTQSGAIYTWGSGLTGQLGNGNSNDLAQTTPLVFEMPTGVTATEIQASTYNGAFIGSDAKVYVWGTANQGTLAGASPTLGCGIFNCTTGGVAITSLPSGVTPIHVWVGEREVMIQSSSGRLYSWGLNDDQQLGTGNTVDQSKSTPSLVALPAPLTLAGATLDYENGLAIVDAITPTITSPNLLTTVVGRPCVFDVHATGTMPLTVTENAVLPPGMGVVDNGDGTATLNCSPQVGEAGVHALRFTAANAYGSANQPFTLTVDQAPQFTSQTTVGIHPNAAFSIPVTSSGYPTPKVTAVSLPRGLHFTPTSTGGTLTGAGGPLGATTTVHFSATNGVAPTATTTMRIVAATVPKITSSALATIVIGKESKISLTSTGTPSPLFSTPASVALRALGLTLSVGVKGGATITGVALPGTAGLHVFTLLASNGYTTAQTFHLTIEGRPTFVTVPNLVMTQGSSGFFVIVATGFPSVTKMSVSGGLDGLVFTDHGNGHATVSGTPTSSGTFAVTLSAANAVGTTSLSASLVVSSRSS